MRRCGGSRRFVRDMLRGEDVAGCREEVSVVEHDTFFEHGYSLLQSFLHVQGWGSAQSCQSVLARQVYIVTHQLFDHRQQHALVRRRSARADAAAGVVFSSRLETRGRHAQKARFCDD